MQCADKKGGGQENRDETNAKQQQDEGDKRERTREKEEGGKKHRKQESGEPEKGEHRHGQEHKSNHKQKNNDEGHERQKRHGDEHRRHGQSHHRNKKDELRSKLPRWPTLVIVCIMSLVCGASGAWGYSALFGASQSADKGKSSGKGGKSSEKGGGSDKSGGGDSDSDQGAELKELKKNFGDLDDGIKQLTARIDRLTESLLESRLPVPEYFAGTSRIARMAPAGEESPPILPNALPTQLNVLRRKVDQMSDLPARVHALEELLPVLQEEIKMLEARRAGP
ncbi:MAG TPA: hypothetical protein VHC22_03080 [Pirellulales bacterium]|nr:hypothetical protein [Pirellulales bacterium]